MGKREKEREREEEEGGKEGGRRDCRKAIEQSKGRMYVLERSQFSVTGSKYKIVHLTVMISLICGTKKKKKSKL